MKDLSNAFTELKEILNNIPREEYNKIPKKFLNMIRKNCNEKYDFKYNQALPLEKQDISEEAKALLSIVYKACLSK